MASEQKVGKHHRGLQPGAFSWGARAFDKMLSTSTKYPPPVLSPAMLPKPPLSEAKVLTSQTASEFLPMERFTSGSRL